MATRRRHVAWTTEQARWMLDEAVGHIARESRSAAQRLLIQALDAASSLDVFGERGRVVPEFDQPNVRQLLVQRYRLISAEAFRGTPFDEIERAQNNLKIYGVNSQPFPPPIG